MYRTGPLLSVLGGWDEVQEMVIPSLHKLALDLVGCQGATCCELGVTRGGLKTPGGAQPSNAPRNFNRGCAVCWGVQLQR